jgi:hypothetical protein
MIFIHQIVSSCQTGATCLVLNVFKGLGKEKGKIGLFIRFESKMLDTLYNLKTVSKDKENSKQISKHEFSF